MSGGRQIIASIGKTMSFLMARLMLILECAYVYCTRAILFLASIPYYFRKPRRCPKITNQLLLLPARNLAAMIRRKQVTSEEVVRAFISRIQVVNPILNALVEDRFDLAIKEAKLVDSMLAKTDLTIDELEQKYPLLGLPLTVKESIAVEGCSHSAGVVFKEPQRAKTDAPVVKLCKEAGAIPISLSNTPELCINFESYNKVTGTTNNPYDTRRTSAGSSGGEGALLGAGASVISLASDLFGSIRIPAHYCGVWGHKASTNGILIEGHFPACESNRSWRESFTMGPMTRYATDLSLLMQVIQKKPLCNLNGNKVNIKDIKFYYIEDAEIRLTHSVNREIVVAIQKLVKSLSGTSCCEKIKIPDFKNAGKYIFPILITLVNSMELPFDDTKYWRELIKYFTFRSNHSLLTVLSMIAKHTTPESINILSKECEKKLETMKKNICDRLGKNGVLIIPTNPSPATFHSQSFGKFDDYTYTGIFNFLGLPVTQCPLGLTSKGLPIGVQVVGIPDNDSLTIAVAEHIEKELGGWIPPPSE